MKINNFQGELTDNSAKKEACDDREYSAHRAEVDMVHERMGNT